MKKGLLFILILLILIPAVWALIYKFEGTAPVADIQLPSKYLRKSYEMSVRVSDEKTGLRHIMVSIMQQGKEKVLLDKTYEGGGFPGIFGQDAKHADSFIIPVESWKYGMADGEALIRVKVSDRSWRKLNKGNLFYSEEKVIIDSKPPRVKVLTNRHNIERGGSGLVIYQLFEPGIKSGISVGENFFPGHPGLFEDPMIHCAFFALDHTQGRGTQIRVSAVDPAGNETTKGFHTYIREKKFKTDTLRIPDSFLENKIPGFEIGETQDQFAGAKNPLLDRYVYINNSIRKANVDKILAVEAATDNKKYWQGRFLRMRGSQRRAGFADRRIYMYKGKEIDRAIHLGIDLASTRNASVEAANTGRVIFTGDIGIFGNTVIIDHGFG